MTGTTEILRVDVNTVGLWTVLSMSGELDVAGIPVLHQGVDEACAAGAPPRLVVDLSAVTFMDSCGLGGLVRAWKQVGAFDGRFVLVGLQPRVAKVFDITGMRRAFEIYESLDDLAHSRRED